MAQCAPWLPTPEVDSSEPALLELRASEGGREARAWCAMLARMYLHWSVSRPKGKGTEIVEWAGDGPGEVRSALLLLPTGWPVAQHESGAHRLTRVSPYGDRDKVHTSWVDVVVVPEPKPVVKPRLLSSDVRVEVFRAGGHGGQGVNTTDSAVRLVHVPTGQKAVCQATRSQLQNKLRAWAILEQRVERCLTPISVSVVSAMGAARRSYILDGHPRVTDGRLGKTKLRPEAVLAGDLDELILA